MSSRNLSPIVQRLFDLPDYVQRADNICSMVNFFPEARRLMDAIVLERVVEIGSEKGLNTAVLLDYVKGRGKRLDTVDPAEVPFPFSPAAEPAFAFYRETSAVYLKRNIPAEVVFMDGDHNYETVLADLKTIHAARKRSGVKLLFLHDVSWPWARQDIYYDLSCVAKPHPHHAENRVSPYVEDGAPALSPGNYQTADCAGGPENGVLTAVEDFLALHGAVWRFLRLPVLYGIGILTCVDNLSEEERRRLLPLEDELASHRELLGILELNRIENLCALDALQLQLKNAGDVWRADQGYIKSVNDILPGMTEELRSSAAKIGELQRALDDKAAVEAELRRDLDASRVELWKRDREIRSRVLELPSERWRTRQNPLEALLPYRFRNRRKLARVRRALSGGEVKLLSLDVFDTLLLRDHTSELRRFSDVARMLHARHPEIGIEAFYHARALAHRLAYATCPAVDGCREPSAEVLFRIEAKILGGDDRMVAELQEVELAYETAHLRPNGCVWDLVLLARQKGIPVVAVSDMYWSGEQIEGLLSAILPDPGAVRKVYSSSDCGVSKASGILFDRVAGDLSVDPSAMLHLGDNRQSDFTVPYVRSGIRSFWLPRSRIHTAWCTLGQKMRIRELKRKNILHGLR